MAHTQPNVQWVRENLLLGLQRPGPFTSTYGEVKMYGDMPPFLHVASWRGAQLSSGKALPLPSKIMRQECSGKEYELDEAEFLISCFNLYLKSLHTYFVSVLYEFLMAFLIVGSAFVYPECNAGIAGLFDMSFKFARFQSVADSPVWLVVRRHTAEMEEVTFVLY